MAESDKTIVSSTASVDEIEAMDDERDVNNYQQPQIENNDDIDGRNGKFMFIRIARGKEIILLCC